MPGLLVACALAVACASAPAGGEAIVRAVPFAARERLVYSLHNLAGDEVGRGRLFVHEAAGDALTLVQEYGQVGGTSGTAPAFDVTTVTADGATLLPFTVARVAEGSSKALRLRATTAVDRSGITIEREGDQPRTVRLGPNAYANESALWLWRTLPLAEGYTQRYVSVDATDGAVALVSVAVKARERIEVPAGSFDTWRVLVRGGRATGVAWIKVEAPHHVVQWDNGAIVFRLVDVGR